MASLTCLQESNKPSHLLIPSSLRSRSVRYSLLLNDMCCRAHFHALLEDRCNFWRPSHKERVIPSFAASASLT